MNCSAHCRYKMLGLLAKMSFGLLARNVKKMLESIKMEMKSNKWNEEDCGPKLTISEDGLTVMYSVGPNVWNSTRSISPFPAINLSINKSKIAYYFEVEILNRSVICIGFSTQQFQLKYKFLGYENSIGIYGRKELWIDGSNLYGNGNESFIVGNVVGIGIIHSPSSMQCFATCNGKLLEKRELPEKFAGFELFPSVSLRFGGQSIRANFGREKWQFKQFDKVLA